MKVFYTYMWLREDGSPYYVGKGTGKRAFVKHHRPAPPRDRILIQEFESESDACIAEMFLIAFYGRKQDGSGILRNLADGGQAGVRGELRTDQHKHNLNAAIALANKTRIVTKASDWQAKCRVGLMNMSETARERMRTGPFKRRCLKGIPKPWDEARRARHKAHYASMTHCKHGHAYSEDNIYTAPGDGGRSCKICRKHAEQRRNAKR